MKVENGKFYFIKDEFFDIFKGYKLMENKENGNKRPCYFCFNDPENEQIIWFVPISSKVEKYREEMPMDYFKAIELIKEDPSNPIITDAIYIVTRIHIPNKIYKYYSLTNDDQLNEAKLDTLVKQKVYLSKPSSFNDPFDTKAFFYKPENLMKFDI